MHKRTAGTLRWLTPSGVSLTIFLLGLIYHDVRGTRDDVTLLKERLARVEATLKLRAEP